MNDTSAVLPDQDAAGPLATGDDKLPKLATKIEVEGVGRKLKMPTEIAASPLKGVDGHFGLGTTISLSSLSSRNAWRSVMRVTP